MRNRQWNPLLILIVALASAFAMGGVDRAHAYTSVSISVSYFYDTLSPYGHWVDYPRYGRCWVPAVEQGWRPYSDGYWVYTDYGWTWVDYEPWGWAVSHYGRWDFDPIYGWVWIPGTVWGPAWVAWHYSDDWVGWAPLPPAGPWQTYAVSYSTVSIERIPARDWCFVPSNRLFDRQLSFVSRERNITLLAQTRNATRFGMREGRPVNEGIDVRAFERSTGRNVTRLATVNASSPRGSGQWAGDRLALYRPTPSGRLSSLRERPLSARDREWADTRSREPVRPTANRTLDRLTTDRRPSPERSAPIERSARNERPLRVERNPQIERSPRSESPSRVEQSPLVERGRPSAQRPSRTEWNRTDRGRGGEHGASFERRPIAEARPEARRPIEERNLLRSPQREERPQVARGGAAPPREERANVSHGRSDRQREEDPSTDETPQREERNNRGQGHGRGKHSG